LLWRGDFETGDFSQWTYLLNPQGLSIEKACVYDGEYAGRITINGNDDMLWQGNRYLNRSEFSYQPANDLMVVSSSERSTARLETAGFRVAQLSDVPSIDLYIEGADEATKHKHLLKGGGGALTREKVLAAAARRFVCIIDESKLVGRLGRFPLPIEVVPMARSFVSKQLIRSGGQPVWREDFVTDNGNQIIDVHNLNIANPIEMENRFTQIPGVVTVGIFAQRPADVLLIASEAEVRTLS
jgi:ribose 5-phosphate isomerase A